MTNLVKAAIATVAAAFVGAAPAGAVDYDINADADFPSVVFIDFDPATMPVVMKPAKGASLSVIGGGRVDMQDGGSHASDRREDEQSGEAQAGGNRPESFGERAEARFEELSRPGSQELEDRLIDREIEDRVLEQFDLRN